jgi:hypothetical protein
MPETETLYVKVRKEVKERLELMAREQARYIVDVASEALERGLGLPASATASHSAGQSPAERLIGTWKLKSCRHVAEDGYCGAWELGKEEAERIYGDGAKELMELRTVGRPSYVGFIQTGVESAEVYSLRPSPGMCFHCIFFERKY